MKFSSTAILHRNSLCIAFDAKSEAGQWELNDTVACALAPVLDISFTAIKNTLCLGRQGVFVDTLTPAEVTVICEVRAWLMSVYSDWMSAPEFYFVSNLNSGRNFLLINQLLMV